MRLSSSSRSAARWFGTVPVCVAVSVALWVAAAEAFPNDPDGFGPLRFGASGADARKAFPSITHKGTEDFLSLYELTGQTVLGLTGCSLQLRFVDDQLYEIQFGCDKREKAAAALQKRFGEPTLNKPDGLFWLGERHTVALNPKSGMFSFSDRGRSQIANQKLLQYIAAGRRNATATPPPAQTPTPPAATPR